MAKAVSDSTDKQVSKLVDRFTKIMEEASTATEKEAENRDQIGHLKEETSRGTDALHTALDQVYSFGKELEKQPKEVKKKFISKFKDDQDKPLRWTQTCEKNVFQPLMKVAFRDAEKSLRSKYGKVLKHAEESQVEAGKFKPWLGKEITWTANGEEKAGAGVVARLAEIRASRPVDPAKEEAKEKKREELYAEAEGAVKQGAIIETDKIGFEGAALAYIYFDADNGRLYVHEQSAKFGDAGRAEFIKLAKKLRN